MASAPAAPTVAPDALNSLLERVVRRAGPARVTVRQLPYRRWELILYHPLEMRPDVYLTYPGDSIFDVLRDALEDPVADLRGLPT